MRLLFIICVLLTVSSTQSSAQNSMTVKYYDSLWNVTTKEKGFYYTRFLLMDNGYNATSYWLKSNQLKSIKIYSDTSMSKAIGWSKKYYESGQMEDSSFYNDNGKMTNSYYYYPNGKLWVHYTYDVAKNKQVTEAYDSNKNPIQNFIYFREAEYPGGKQEWIAYLGRNIKTNVPVKKGAPIGLYQTIVRFMIDIDGKLNLVEAETTLGFGMEEEALRVINKSPKWIPAIWLNKPIKAYRRQPLTFVVTDR